MYFKGRLKLPGEGGEGVAVELAVHAPFLVVTAAGEELGRWRVDQVHVSRLHSDHFELALGDEVALFVADDALGFAYDGIRTISELAEGLRKRRRWFRFRRRSEEGSGPDRPPGSSPHPVEAPSEPTAEAESGVIEGEEVMAEPEETLTWAAEVEAIDLGGLMDVPSSKEPRQTDTGGGYRSWFHRDRPTRVAGHEHDYRDLRTVGGITRRICVVCGRVSIVGENVYQDWL